MTAQPNASLIGGLACLQAVMTAGEAVGSREIARRLDMVHTRCNRLLGTLAELGLVEQDERRKYRIGPAAHVLAAHGLHASGLIPAAMPALAEWHQEGFTVALGVLWQGQVCFLVHVRPGQPLHESIGRHELWPAASSAVGLALLEFQNSIVTPSDASLDSLLPEERDLGAAIRRTRADGHALRRFTNGETSLGVVVGAPPQAAIAISHRHLDAAAIPALAARLHASAQRIVAALASPVRTR